MFLPCPAIFLVSWYRSPLQLFLTAISASAKLFSLLRLSARALAFTSLSFSAYAAVALSFRLTDRVLPIFSFNLRRSSIFL